MIARKVILASLTTAAFVAGGCGSSSSDSGGAAVGTTTDTAVSGQQPNPDGGRFQPPPDVTAPKGVLALAARPGPRLGTTELVLSIPDDELDYEKIEIRREIGDVASGDCDAEAGNAGGIIETFTEDFAAQTTVLDTALTPGVSYAYTACAFDEKDNVSATAGIAGKSNDDQRIFVTSDDTFTGDFTLEYDGKTFESGLDGADYRCQKLADDAKLGGYWRAVLGKRTTPADAFHRMPIYSGKIRNIAGEMVAVGRDNLYNDIVPELQNGIVYDENGTEVDPSLLARVWTGSIGYNTVTSSNRYTCADWSSASTSDWGLQGTVGELDDDWLVNYATNCDAAARLYCLETGVTLQTSPTIAIADGSTAGTVDVTVDFPDDTTGYGRVVLRRGQGLTATNDACLTGHPWGVNVKIYNGTEDQEFTDETYTDTPAADGQYHYDLCVYDSYDNLVEVVRPDAGIVVGTSYGLVFVSSTTTTGAFSSNALTGAAAADNICQTLATTAELNGTYEALLATSSASMLSRSTVDKNFYDLAGNFLFGSNSDANSGYVSYLGITKDENGEDVSSTARVWTGAYYPGSTASSSCSDWTSASSSSSGEYGNPLSYLSYSDWYSVSTQTCDQTAHLYCIKQ